MIEESHLGHYVQSELIVFSVKYRTNTKTFQVPKDTHINEIVEFVVNEFQEFAAEPKDFRLGIFSGESLVSYISNENRYLLKNDLAVLLQAPNISSNQLKSLLACVCECLRTPSRLDEVGNLCDRLGELLRYMSCGEFALYFVDNGGIAALFELATATSQCDCLREDLRAHLWRHIVTGLAALITFDPILLEGGSEVDITAFPFAGVGIDWEQIPDETVCQIMNSHSLTDEPHAYRNYLLILLSFVRACPCRAWVLVENNVSSFIYTAVDANRTKRPLPPISQSQSQSKLGRSSSRLGGLSVRPKALFPNSTPSSLSLCVPSPPTTEPKRITEIQLFAVALVYAIYEACSSNITEVLNLIPSYCIASVVEILAAEVDNPDGHNEPTTPLQGESRDETSSSVSRSSNIFYTLKSRRNLMSSGGLARITRMNSMQSESLPISAPYPRSPIDSTLTPDEKSVPIATDPMELAVKDVLIGLQKFVVQPYADMANAPLDEGLVKRTLRDLCELLAPEITHLVPGNETTTVYRICEFSNPEIPQDDFKQPPGNLGVVCLSTLVKHRAHLVRRILECQGALNAEAILSRISESQMEKKDEVEASLTPTCVLAWLGAANGGGGPTFPLLPAVKAVTTVICEHFGIVGNSSLEEQLNPLLFQSSPNADSVFAELFLHCFDAFYDSWFAVNAAPSDMPSISRVLRTSLKSALSGTHTSFEDLARYLSHFSLDSVRREWMMEDEEKEKNHPAVQELHRDLVKQHFATVTKQRLYTMSNGPPLEYLRHTKKEVQRFRVSLSPDQNLLLVRDASNHVVETWPLSSIVSVSSIPEDRKSKHGDWTVVLNLDKEHPLEQETESFIGATGISRSFMAKQRHNQIVLVAPSEHIQSAWIDGFSRLREAKFTSAAFADDMNMITNLEMRIRLLGLDLDTVPARPVEKPLVYPPLDGLLF